MVDFVSRKQTIPLQDSCKQSRFAFKKTQNCSSPDSKPSQQRQWSLHASLLEKKGRVAFMVWAPESHLLHDGKNYIVGLRAIQLH